jgi:hypothetical protein
MNERSVTPEDAHKRAIEDYSQFSQYARSSAQMAFAANGGAAAAMLSYLTALTTSSTHGARKLSTQAVKQARNASGSIAAMTSHSVSWLGTPCAKRAKRRRN